MVYLPEDMIGEILLRLPVKNLVRSKFVCKSWLALISSPYFVKLHLNRSAQTKRNLSIFLRLMYDLFRVDFDSIDDGVLQRVETDYFRLRFPGRDISICGSCDGLILLNTGSFMDNVVFLWNPSTKRSIRLPSSGEIFYKNLISCAYRFGYDSSNNDYKVVKLMSTKIRERIIFYISIYSLKSNSWQKSNKVPAYCSPEFISIGDSIASGAMHWISYVGTDSNKKDYIIAFDFGTQKYRAIPPPELIDSHYCLCLDNLEGSLSATCHYTSWDVDIFLLKNYRMKNQYWIKLISISHKLSTGPFLSLKPIVYSKCGNKVLFHVDYESLIWYDLVQKSYKKIREGDNIEDITMEVYPCLESIVSLELPNEA